MTTFRCRDLTFSIEAERAEDADFLAGVLAPFAGASGQAGVRYTLRTEGPDRYWLDVDDMPLRVSADPREPVDVLLWHLGEQVVASEPESFVLHAGAVVAPDGRALLLPGRSGSGKSTTTAGLVRSGLGYLTDEYVFVDPADGRVSGLPRALVIKDDAAGLLGATPTTGQSHLTAEALGGRTVEGSVVPGWVVLPTYAAGARTELTGLTPGETCSELARSTFHLTERPGQVLEVMAGLARSVHGYALTVGDLGDAVAVLRELVGAQP